MAWTGQLLSIPRQFCNNLMSTSDRLWASLRQTFVTNEETNPGASRQSQVESATSSYTVPAIIITTPIEASSSRHATFPTQRQDNSSFRFQQRLRLIEVLLSTANHVQPSVLASALIDRHEPNNVAITAAMDAICIAQVTATLQQDRSTEATRILTSNALRLICWLVSATCQTQTGRTPFGDAIGAIHYNMFRHWLASNSRVDETCASISQQLKDTIQNCHNIVHRDGWEAATSSLTSAFCAEWQLRAMCVNMALRRTIPPQSLRRPPRVHINNPLLQFCAFKIPELLEQSGALLREPGSRANAEGLVMNLLISLGHSVAILKRSHVQWASELPPRFRMIGIKTFKDFVALKIGSIDVFPFAYNFRSVSCEREFRLSYVCLLELDQAIINIHEAHAAICTSAELQFQLTVTKDDAREAADTLCMLVPWIVQEQKSAFTCVQALMPLYYAAEYYHRHGCQERLDWCKQVLQALGTKYGIWKK